VGFLAAGVGDIRRAEIIFGALVRFRPQRAFAHVGRAIAYSNAGRHDEAARILADALVLVADVSERCELEAFRGLVLHLGGRTSESVRALIAAGDVRLAQVMLGEAKTVPVR